MKVLRGDVLEYASVEPAMLGQEAVVSALGASLTSSPTYFTFQR